MPDCRAVGYAVALRIGSVGRAKTESGDSFCHRIGKKDHFESKKERRNEKMPRDKSLSHEKVKKAIREEFLEKGYEAASIRSIGARAGMTSAGLYWHYADKEAMYAAVVDPLDAEIKGCSPKENHCKCKS